MKGSKLNAAYARRRDVAEMKIEKTKEVDKYFDKWNQITTRYGHWTAPEYYQMAQENFQIDQQKKIKGMNLQLRRERLRTLLLHEKQQYDEQLKKKSQMKSQKASTETLRNIRETCIRTEEEHRRLELESSLYKRWRGLSDDILVDTKSDHAALAKMNWLDKQIAKQMEKEKVDKESEERQLQLRMEERKHQELLSARKMNMEAEIAELLQIQEKHLGELKLREQETEKLHSDELQLRQNHAELADELTKLEIQVAQRHERIRCPHNLRRIRMLLRERSDAIRKDLRFDIDLLDRIPCSSHNQLQIKIVREKFEMQYDLEIQKQTQIEAMYESEAKIELLQLQEIWLKDSLNRERQLRALLKEQQQIIESEIDFVVRKQTELVDIREHHRAVIANATERIKHLQTMDRDLDTDSVTQLQQVDKLADEIGDKVTVETNGNHRPKFGRKKIAWT